MRDAESLEMPGIGRQDGEIVDTRSCRDQHIRQSRAAPASDGRIFDLPGKAGDCCVDWERPVVKIGEQRSQPSLETVGP